MANRLEVGEGRVFTQTGPLPAMSFEAAREAFNEWDNANGWAVLFKGRGDRHPSAIETRGMSADAGVRILAAYP